MSDEIATTFIPNERIMDKIFLLRDQKVMIDSDLADLYGVSTKVLKQQVRRNSDRFPNDFMFELTENEFSILRSQFVTSSWGGVRLLFLLNLYSDKEH